MNPITNLIINWFLENKRSLPWRNEKNAYHILLSEIIMQQTRIEQGTPYFLKILEAFPTIEHLAAADEEVLLRLWQGLGYYSRARNLHSTAKFIVNDYGGKIPETFDELKRLKGIGDYTATAIASIAYDQPEAVIDGNVIRIVSRLFAIEAPIDSAVGKKLVKQYLETIFNPEQPGVFNEAIMDFGALQCVPSNPNCKRCPLVNYCKANQLLKVDEFPVKAPSKEVKTRYLNYLFLLIDEKYTVMRQRSGNDIWKNLYEFPLIETEKTIVDAQLYQMDFWKSLNLFHDDVELCFVKIFKQQHKLTHRLLKATFTVALLSLPENLKKSGDFLLIPVSEADNKPKPILLANFLKKYHDI